MDIERIIREKFRVFLKLIKAGYDSDKKIIDMKIEELIQAPNFNRRELSIAVGIKNSLINKSLVSFLCEINEESLI